MCTFKRIFCETHAHYCTKVYLIIFGDLRNRLNNSDLPHIQLYDDFISNLYFSDDFSYDFLECISIH